ncbi:haloacid dehalogenase type II [Streptomyces endophyticus]|uniref:Haloacid dehalogenase type II n=1 Tax=Streptomyces endophyticus TaxID=714166 RepID=A0ABU6F4E5_9ACTN|nr:haloacid dehalogenase type II [Streptomyces endophyticus]MEB8338280.1 haloacid dehalogenase type II [Streptomyces endophyticus]
MERRIQQVEAVLFDTFGTVVDWRTGVSAAVDTFAARHGLTLDATAFAVRWRDLYQPAMEPIRTGERGFTPLDVLHAENLRTVLAEHGIDAAKFDEVELTWLNEAWHRLPAWPDSAPGLEQLARSVTTGALSNGNLALLSRLAKHAGLPWDVIVASDVTRAYKPQPQAYERAAAFLGLRPDQVMLAAAHNEDLRAARDAGLRTAFIARPTEHGPTQTTNLAPDADWDVVAGDLVQLATLVGDRPWTADRHLLPPGRRP